MRKQAKIQYTVRDVPVEVDRALRARARRRRTSLNQIIVEELAQATVGQRRRTDFSDVAGGLHWDGPLEAALAAQRQIDEDLWR